MRRFCAVIVLLLTGLLWHGPAQASGDFGCYPSWTLEHHDLTGCDDMAMLSPGNDTRTNLVLLMMELRAEKDGKPAALPASTTKEYALFDWPTFGARLVPPPADADSSDGYTEGQGSRCLSDAAGEAAFAGALTAAKDVPDNERALLTDARKNLAPTCTGASGGAEGVAKAAGEVQSPLGKSFAAYLQGAQAFYDGNYDAAAAAFAGIASADDTWLKETARYMQGRVEVNRAQVDAFDEYGAPKEGSTIDPKVIDAAEAGLQNYLKDYPDGAYASSARGLLRRVYWLGGRADKLAAQYAELLAVDPEPRGLDDIALADEIDNKLLPGLTDQATTDPTLLAVLDLKHMRGPDGADDKDCCGQPMTRAALEAQKPAFAANPALYAFLDAAYAFYVERKPDTVLKLIPDEKSDQGFGPLAFSRQTLRGMALEALKDPAARDHWLAMLPGALQPFQHPAIELAIALHDERDHALDRVFAPDSLVKEPILREILLRNVADATLLRARATDATAPKKERDAALFTLLYKELTRGRPGDFLTDLDLVLADVASEGQDGSEGVSDEYNPIAPTPLPTLGVFQNPTSGEYDCLALKETAWHLAKNAQDSRAQLCLADFLLVNGFDDFVLDTPPDARELGGSPSLFPGKPYARLTVYKTLIAGANTPANDKAYALYRAVNCYAPSGNNSCGGDDVPVAQRKAWFNQLKHNYPKSVWAKQLQYYW